MSHSPHACNVCHVQVPSPLPRQAAGKQDRRHPLTLGMRQTHPLRRRASITHGSMSSCVLLGLAHLHILG
jgi:hypothetical protein